MIAFDPNADIAVCLGVNSAMANVTAALQRGSMSSLHVDDYFVPMHAALSITAAAKQYTSQQSAIDVHVKAMEYEIPTFAASSMRISLNASHGRLAAQLPPIPLYGGSSSSGPRVLTPESATQAVFSAAEQDAIDTTTADDVHNPTMPGWLRTAYIAHGSTPPGFSGSAVWALNQTAVPFTTTMVAVVSGYRDHTHQVYMSPITPLHDPLALIFQELEPLLLDGQYWSCSWERHGLLLHMLRPLNLAESNSTVVPLLVKDMIRDAAVCKLE